MRLTRLFAIALLPLIAAGGSSGPGDTAVSDV